MRLRHWPWFVFTLQQASLFLSGMLFLHAVRGLSGHELHGAKDAPTALEGLGILSIYALHLGITVVIYRWAKGRDATPLGVVPSRAAAWHFGAGTLAAFAMYAWPWLGALVMGRAHVGDTLVLHWRPAYAALIPFGISMLVMNSVVEEATCRAFPMQLWSHRGGWFRILVPALAFAALHLTGEPFRADAFLSRTSSGVILGVAYAMTGNVWLTAGIHTGMNYAGIVHEGQWHVGSLFVLDGEPLVPNLVVRVVSAIAVCAVFGLRKSGISAVGSEPASPT